MITLKQVDSVNYKLVSEDENGNPKPIEIQEIMDSNFLSEDVKMKLINAVRKMRLDETLNGSSMVDLWEFGELEQESI